MSFMQRNINIFLFMVVVGVLMAIGVTSLYYQQGLKDLSTNLENQSTHFKECSLNLNQKTSELAKISESLNYTKEDISKYDVLYVNKSIELDTTKSNLEETTADLKSTKSSLADTKASLQDYTTKYTTEKILREGLETEVSSLTKQVSDWKSASIAADAKIDKLKDDIADLEAELATCGTGP